jgi:hypothetical protein
MQPGSKFDQRPANPPMVHIPTPGSFVDRRKSICRQQRAFVVASLITLNSLEYQ